MQSSSSPLADPPPSALRAERLLAEEALLLESMARGAALEGTLVAIAELAERHLEGARCSVGVLDDRGRIRHRTAPTIPREVLVAWDAVEPDDPLALALRAGDDLLIHLDLPSHPLWSDLLAGTDHGIARAMWSLRVSQPEGRLLGLFTVLHEASRGPTEEELSLLHRVRHLAAIAIERDDFQARLERQALYDPLTQLPNRTLLLNRIDHALTVAVRHGHAVAVLFVDLDHFKVVNDSLGHAAGDELLRQVAARLEDGVREADTVGRFGGDELVVVCEELHEPAEATAVAARIAEVLTEPFVVRGSSLHVTASVGIAISDGEPVTADSLIRDADAAMYAAKGGGRARAELFEPSLRRRAVERLRTEHDLRAALRDGQLVLHHQPMIDLHLGRAVGVEALVRWEHPTDGLVLPGRFIDLAEETGLIVPLGEVVLRAACEQLVAWARARPDLPLSMSVNLSGRQLGDPAVVDRVAGIVRSAGIPAGALCLEVTETALVQGLDRSGAALDRLHDLGVNLAIDDFGTGYASLDYLRRLPTARAIKIDRSFVGGLVRPEPQDRAIVAAAVVLADQLGLDAVAEGVETLAQLAILRDMGCRLAQGFLFARPAPPDQTFEQIVAWADGGLPPAWTGGGADPGPD
jgi:diguanylate cyclase (GGDEF)-like protein